MLSLTRTITRMDQEERLYRSALGCYLTALSLLQEYPLETDADVFRAFKNGIRAIHVDVVETRAPEVLEKSSEALKGALRSYYGGAGALAARRADDLRAVMGALAEAAHLLGRQHAGHAKKLRLLTSRLQESEKVTDLGRMRRQIVGHVADLRAINEAVQHENIQALSALQSQLSEFSRRLDNAEQRACLDGLTGLLNRGEGEARLCRMVASGRPACAILVDLNGFKQINDSWGHSAGDQVLKTCARILSEQTRVGDLVCRWGGDEFLLVLQCSEGVAGERAKSLRERVRVPQKIAVLGKIYEVSVSASIGVTTLRESESAEDFITRVDAEMYRDKSRKAESSLA